MATAAVVWGNRLRVSRVVFCFLKVFPSKKTPWMSTSVPSPKVYQITLSPAHISSPARFPYIRPFTAEIESIWTEQYRDEYENTEETPEMELKICERQWVVKWNADSEVILNTPCQIHWLPCILLLSSKSSSKGSVFLLANISIFSSKYPLMFSSMTENRRKNSLSTPFC